MLRNKSNAIILVDIYTIRYDFINKKFVKIVCQIFKIEFQYLIKLKLIKRFDGKVD